MFKCCEILDSLEKIFSQITPDYIADELANIMFKNGLISVKKEDITKVLNSTYECEYSIFVQSNKYKNFLSFYDIFEDKNMKKVKYIVLVIKHNGSLTSFKITKFINDIKLNLGDFNIEILAGDYIDENTDEVKVSTLILR